MKKNMIVVTIALMIAQGICAKPMIIHNATNKDLHVAWLVERGSTNELIRPGQSFNGESSVLRNQLEVVPGVFKNFNFEMNDDILGFDLSVIKTHFTWIKKLTISRNQAGKYRLAVEGVLRAHAQDRSQLGGDVHAEQLRAFCMQEPRCLVEASVVGSVMMRVSSIKPRIISQYKSHMNFPAGPRAPEQPRRQGLMVQE